MEINLSLETVEIIIEALDARVKHFSNLIKQRNQMLKALEAGLLYYRDPEEKAKEKDDMLMWIEAYEVKLSQTSEKLELFKSMRDTEIKPW